MLWVTMQGRSSLRGEDLPTCGLILLFFLNRRGNALRELRTTDLSLLPNSLFW
jgi:hypothetical protein